jgi:hypothetical protein
MIDIDVTTKIKQNVVTMLITKTMHGQEHKRVSEGVSLQGVVFISLLVLSFFSLLSPPFAGARTREIFDAVLFVFSLKAGSHKNCIWRLSQAYQRFLGGQRETQDF